MDSRDVRDLIETEIWKKTKDEMAAIADVLRQEAVNKNCTIVITEKESKMPIMEVKRDGSIRINDEEVVPAAEKIGLSVLHSLIEKTTKLTEAFGKIISVEKHKLDFEIRF